MSVSAAPLQMLADAAPRPRPRRLTLAQKLALAFLGLVATVLAINGVIDMGLTYRDARTQAIQVQQEKADAAADKVVQFVSEIESQLGWTTRAEWARIGVDQRRYDFIRLLRQSPAITELIHVDGTGHEQLKLSRLEPDQVGSNADYSADPRFVATLRDKIYYGPVTFRRGSEPYMTIGMLHAGNKPGATIADVNLKLAWDVVTAIRVGSKGYAFITDPAGRLIAHPDMSLVLRNTDFAIQPQVAAAVRSGAGGRADPVTAGRSVDGSEVLSAHARIPKVGWNVFVEQPASEALARVYSALYQTLALLGLGVGLAGAAGTMLARRMVVPITELEAGAKKLGEGDLTQRIPVRSGDEIGALASRFNIMAGHIQEAQETLEAKVVTRTEELNEALQYQTATSEVLSVISRSPNDLQPVLDAIITTASRLCNARRGTLWRLSGNSLEFGSTAGQEPDHVAYLKANPRALDRSSLSGRCVLERRTMHIHDIHTDPDMPASYLAIATNVHTMLAVPLLREGVPIGTINLVRTQVSPFTDRQIKLVETFADQAVIAINNVGLFEEVQAKTNEVTEALEYQTATSDVLNVISKSPNQVQPVFDAIVATARQLCHAQSAWILQLKDGRYHLAAKDGTSDPAFDKNLAANPLKPDRTSITGRVALEGRTVHIRNVAEDKELTLGTDDVTKRDGTRIGVPLLRGSEVSGVIVLRRDASTPFSDREIGLVETFAEQAVIAVGNAKLFEEVQARTRDLSKSLETLRAAQDRLIQTEKLASLGQLTAGVAHEIKNPLNFVNNFADLSIELVGEMEEAIAGAGAALDAKIKSDVGEIAELLKGNLAKVVHHGRRADSIVKNMLAHSRASGGERRAVDLNAAVDEALGLAYHGARAEKPGFNITLERNFDPTVGQVEVFPQELTRVVLNLIGNGFHAANKKRLDGAPKGFEPTLRVTTKAYPDKIKIKVRDNGTGIPDSVKARIFEPFFTTKPTGEGTGLGLSLSHDIVVKQHGGKIEVATEPGQFTEFSITLPRVAATSETDS